MGQRVAQREKVAEEQQDAGWRSGVEARRGGPQCAVRLIDRRVFQLAIGLQLHKELEDHSLAQSLQRLAFIEPPQAPHPRQIRLADAGLEISKLDKGAEVLLPWLRGEAAIIVLFFPFHST